MNDTAVQISIEEAAEATGISAESWGVAPGESASLWADGTMQSNSKHGVLVLAQPGSVDPKTISDLARLYADRLMSDQPKTPARAVRVDGALWRAAQGRAAERGETVSDVIRRALRWYTRS